MCIVPFEGVISQQMNIQQKQVMWEEYGQDKLFFDMQFGLKELMLNEMPKEHLEDTSY